MIRWVMFLIGINLLAWNVLVPIFEANEESNYYQYAYYLAREGKLPDYRYPPGDEAGVIVYPPAYFVPLLPIVAILQSPSLYDADSVKFASERLGRFRHDFFNRFEHSEREINGQWNRQGWAVHLMRLVSNVWGWLTVLLVYKTGRLIFKQESLAILAAIFTGFNPMFTHIQATLTVNSLLILIASLAIYLMLRWARKMSRGKCLILGMLIGLGIITKITSLFLLPIVLVGHYWLIGKMPKLTRLMKDWLVVLTGILVTAGWFMIRNWWLYGNWLSIKQMVGVANAKEVWLAKMGPVNYWVGFFTSYATSFWTGYGWSAVFFDRKLIYALIMMMFMAMIGVYKLIKSKRIIELERRRLLFLIGCGLILLLVLLLAHAQTPTFHAKEIYPVIVPISLLTVAGWNRWLKLDKFLSRRSWSLGILAVILLAINLTYLWLDVVPKLIGLKKF